VFVDASSAALLGAALLRNSTLTLLTLQGNVWHNPDAAAALLGALTGHSSMRKLNLAFNNVLQGARAVAGAAFGALVAANVPALTELDVSDSALGDAGLLPLLEALPANTHLRTLDVSYNGISAACARDVLLRAVRANTSLRTLHAHSEAEHPDEVDAIALVAARGGAGGAA
jgi:hypothetical protein